MKKILNIIAVLVVIGLIINFYMSGKAEKNTVKKTHGYPGSTSFSYALINSTKYRDWLYEGMSGEKKNLIFLRDTKPEDFRVAFEKQYIYDTNLNMFYNYMCIFSPKPEDMKCLDGTDNCFVFFFLKHCNPQNAVMCIVNPISKEILPVPPMEPEQIIEFLEKHKDW